MLDFNKSAVSIIIPIYNRALIIEKTLISIVNQTYLDWECIIVDDASTDNTIDVVNRFINTDSRFRLISNHRAKGAQGARNTGILNATSAWIAFNDSDDEWMPDKLKKQFQILEKYSFSPYLVIHTDCIVNDHYAHTKSVWNLPLVEGHKPFKTLLRNSSPMFQGMVTSKLALQQINLLDENTTSYQEWDTSILLSKICHFVHLKEPLFIYHKHKEDTISKNIKRDIEGMNYIRTKFKIEFIKFYGEPLFVKLLLENIHRTIALNIWDFGVLLLKSNEYQFSPSTYKYWLKSFAKKIDPLKKKEYFMIFRRLLKKVKSKFYD